jgi:hypothetical protein
MDSNRKLYVAWRQGQEIVFSKSTDYGESFSYPVIASDSTGSGKSYPSIDVDTEENIYIAWQDYRDSHTEIYFTRSIDGGISFEPDIRLTLQYAQRETHPILSIDKTANNYIYIAWLQSGQIRLARSNDGGLSFDHIIEPLSDFEDFTSVTVKVDDEGIVCLLALISNEALYYISSTDHAESFSQPTRVDPDLQDTFIYGNPTFFANAGKVYVTWPDNRVIDEFISIHHVSFALSMDNGLTFEEPVFVSEICSDSVFKTLGGLVANKDGHIFVTWDDCRIDPFFCEQYRVYCSRGDEEIDIQNDDVPPNIPNCFTLSQNYPNPFNPTTTISFSLPGETGETQHLILEIYDLRGRLVKKLVDGEYYPGQYKVIWTGMNNLGQQVSSGIYLYTIKGGVEQQIKKMVVRK